MKINVKEMKTQKTYQVECEADSTGADLIQKISEASGHAATEMKLIIGTQIIKKDKTLQQNKCFDGCTVTLTLSAKAQVVSTQTTNVPQIKVGQNDQLAQQAGGVPEGQAAKLGNPLFPDMQGGMTIANQQQIMRQMQESPEAKQIMSALFNDPERVKQMIQTHPGIKKMMEKNPDIAQALNNPETLKQIADTFSDPVKFDEQMRQIDTQITNIQNMPDGQLILNKLQEQMNELYDGSQQSNTKGWFMPGEGNGSATEQNEKRAGDTIFQQLLTQQLINSIKPEEPLPMSYVQSLIPQSITYNPFGQDYTQNAFQSSISQEAQIDMMLDQFKAMGISYDEVEQVWDNPYVQQTLQQYGINDMTTNQMKQLLMKRIAEKRAGKSSQGQAASAGGQNMLNEIQNLRQKWQSQYKMIKDMGIDLPEDEILHLLDIYNGDISAVLSHIYDNN